MQFSDTYIVYGMGKSGLATASAILKAGGTVYIGDDKIIDDTVLPNAHRLDKSLKTLPKATALIGAPGIALTHPKPHHIYELANAVKMPILCDVELFYRVYHRQSNVQFIAITGTNGKSTTTAITTHLLNHAGHNAVYGGNIGTAVFELVIDHKPIIYVLEVSSYQADMCFDFAPDSIGFLNLTPDHIDRHGTIDTYFASKMRLFQHLSIKGKAHISGHEFNQLGAWETKAVHLANQHNALITLSEAQCTQIKELIKNNPYLAGNHNYTNSLTACALIYALGIDDFSGLLTYQGLPHRTEFVTKKHEIQFINDSKATNAEATRPALNAYKNIYWLAGGVQKSEGIMPLIKHDVSQVKHAYFYGEAGARFYEVAEAHNLPCTLSDTLENALKIAFKDAKGDESLEKTVLLSPSCASFDAFSNFEHRGNFFKQLVETL
ncbi:MAG: UDP-N-acetylmuramoylalanine--D-glutamate ligase [Alphaproteobacteria bacterium]|jgi:UDP-N-acetylmuramoylalanine--D-glutamate ligase